MNGSYMEIAEYDEAGKVTATFVQSSADKREQDRIDIIPSKEAKSLWFRAVDVFLPVGYPHSVTKDYLEYQIYDSLQAFSSSIAGMLASRAALSSVGVGDSTASPTAALLLSVLQESAGRVATILFAYRFGSALEPECKMYRLLADVLNDIGFVLDCLSPAFPKPIRVLVLSFSSVLRALCGVAAGSAKASLSNHFARWGNLGELNAKDSSQETVISLIGMLAGSLVVSWVTTPVATWTTLLLLLSIHLETNRRAVRAVSMRTLNRQRATLVYHHLRQGHVPTPEEISAQEYIFESDGVIRDVNGTVAGYCTIGGSLSKLLRMIPGSNPTARSYRVDGNFLKRLSASYKDRAYLLVADARSHSQQIAVVIKQGATTVDLLTAWWHACVLVTETDGKALRLAQSSNPSANGVDLIMQTIDRSMRVAAGLLKDYEVRLKAAGWDLDTSALETTSSSRIAASL